MQDSNSTKTCPFCAEAISELAIKCKHCGSMLTGTPTATTPGSPPVGGSGNRIQPSGTTPNPLLMALLSGCVIAGLGQMILGQVTKGIVIFVATIVVAFLTFGVGAIIVYIISAIDAYSIAQKLKDGKSVGEWEWF
jgi:TM2 domain-containing membrane protein YozV